MRHIILLLLLCFKFLVAADFFSYTEQSVFDTVIEINQSKAIAPSDDLVIDTNLHEESDIYKLEGNTSKPKPNEVKQRNLYLYYLNYPENIYTNQRFSISLKAIITTDDFDTIKTTFTKYDNLEILNPDESWLWKNYNLFTNKFIFKASDDKLTMPTIEVGLYKNNLLVESVVLKPKEVNYQNIAISSQNFCNVLAKNLTVKSQKTKQYDNNRLLVLIELEAQEGNLEDFDLKRFQDKGIESFSEEYPYQKIFYYLIIPNHIQEIKFNYYNIAQNKFEDIEIPIIIKTELISTQTDLNPQNSSLLTYKKIFFGLLFILFLFLYYLKRRLVYIIFAIFSAALLIQYILPNPKATIDKDTKVFILPTKKSTIFKIADKKETIEILNHKQGFVKILFPNQTIGWVKKNDIK